MASHGSQTLRMPVESTGRVELETSNNGRPLYPSMIENPQLFWRFTRKVYAMLAIQLLITVAVAALVISRPAIPKFVLTKPGLIVYIFTLIVSFILLYPLQLYHKEHPVNLVLLMLFTIAIAFAVGLTCSFSMVTGRVILLAGILKSVAVVSLTLYTFWAEKKGYEFSFLGPFLIASILVLIVFALIQIFIPLGNLRSMIIGGLGAIMFSYSIIYNTRNLINQFEYDEYIWAAVTLYPSIVKPFLAMFKASDGNSDASAKEGESGQVADANVEEGELGPGPT